MNDKVPAPRDNRELDLKPAQLSLIRRTLASQCNDAEFDLYIEQARRLRADPFRRHIYAIVFSPGDAEKRRLSIICGIDFYRSVAARNRDYRPDGEPPTYVFEEALKSPQNPLGIVKAVVRGWKFGPDRQWYPIIGEAYWGEYCPLEDSAEKWEWVETGGKWPDGKAKKFKQPVGVITERPKGKWREMPLVMIAKCAEAVMLRKGWPEDLSGVYVEEEMDRARQVDLSASEYAEQHNIEKRLALTKSNDAVMILWAPGEPLEAVPVGAFGDRVLAFLKAQKSTFEIEAWRESNRAPLADFWARHKSDALELSKAIEQRMKDLSDGKPE